MKKAKQKKYTLVLDDYEANLVAFAFNERLTKLDECIAANEKKLTRKRRNRIEVFALNHALTYQILERNRVREVLSKLYDQFTN